MTVVPLATGPLGDVLSLLAGVGGGDDRGEALLLGITSQEPPKMPLLLLPAFLDERKPGGCDEVEDRWGKLEKCVVRCVCKLHGYACLGTCVFSTSLLA